MKIKDLEKFLHNRSYGASFEEIRNEFNVEDEEIKRIVNSAKDLEKIKQSGKGRGTRYFHVEVEIPERNESSSLDENRNEIGGIDLTDCKTEKDKIKRILESSKPLPSPITISYQENLLDKPSGKKLADFIRDGIKLVEIGLYYDLSKKSNVIYKKQERVLANQISIQREGNEFIVKKVYRKNSTYPEIESFPDYEELREYLRVNLK